MLAIAFRLLPICLCFMTCCWVKSIQPSCEPWSSLLNILCPVSSQWLMSRDMCPRGDNRQGNIIDKKGPVQYILIIICHF